MSQKILKYKIPKGSKDCKGVECEIDLEFDIPMPETPTPAAVFIPQPSIVPQTIAPQVAVTTGHEGHDHSKKLTHEELAELIPKGINYAKCVGSDCGGMKIKNSIQTTKYKTCPNGDCEANTVPKGTDFCPYCNKGIAEDADLDDGIDITKEEEEDSDE